MSEQASLCDLILEVSEGNMPMCKVADLMQYANDVECDANRLKTERVAYRERIAELEGLLTRAHGYVRQAIADAESFGGEDATAKGFAGEIRNALKPKTEPDSPDVVLRVAT